MAILKTPSILKEKRICRHGQFYRCSVHIAILIFAGSADCGDPGRHQGAPALLRTAVRAGVSTFIAGHAQFLDEDGRQRLVRQGFLPEREVMTGIGTVPVQVPRVRDRGSNADGSRIRSARRWFRRIFARRSRPGICCPGFT